MESNKSIANLKIYLKSGSSSPLRPDIHYSGVHNE